MTTPIEIVEYIESRLEDGFVTRDEIVYEIREKFNFRITVRSIDKYKKAWRESLCKDKEIITQNVRLAKDKQKAQDINRVERKSFREYAREENALSELISAITVQIDKLRKPVRTVKHGISSESYGAIVQLSDVHFNERVENVGGNSYDFTISGKRLRKHILHSMRIFDAYNVKNVVLALTGDMFNSDRRLDEVLCNATNRARGFLLGFDVMTQVIMELNQRYNVTVASVCGNEGRIDQNREYSEITASNNFDFMLHGFLERFFKDKEGVNFEFQHPNTCIIKMNGKHILLLHGDNSDAKDPRKMMVKAKAKFDGQPIDYVLSGHIHEACISDWFSRSGSPVGNNAYNFDGLNISGKASQNSYIISPNGSIHGFKIDLQDYEHIDGYDITPELESYNAKSASKLQHKTTILEVRV